MAARSRFPQVITANRLKDGEVVYRASDGSWTPHLTEAQVFAAGSETEAVAAAQTDVVNRLIVEPYPFDVDAEADTPTPRSARELIRARGPSVRDDLGKQAEPGAVVPTL